MIKEPIIFALVIVGVLVVFTIVLCVIIFYKERDFNIVVVPTHEIISEHTEEMYPPGKPTDPIAVPVFPPRVQAYQPRLAWQE